VKTPRFALLAVLACAAVAGWADPAPGQFTWNNTGTNFSSAGSWDPAGGPPGAADTAQFTPAGAPLSTPISQPTIDANRTIKSLILAPTPLLGGWTFSGSSTLTIDFPGLNAYGPATYTFDGPAIQGPPGANQLLNITTGSTVVLRGNSTVPANAGTIFLHGGTLVLDNSVNNSGSRLPLLQSSFNVQSGTLELRGNTSAATNFGLGPLTINGGTFSGVNTIRLVPGGGGQLSANFNNTGTNFSTQFSSPSFVFRAEATSGVLGGPGANDPRMTFTGTPALGANGLLASSAGGASFGHFIVSDANGTDFATWNATDGVKAAGATLTSNNATGAGSISTGTASSRVFYTPGTGTQTATAPITNGSLRITPTATGAVLAMGANDLQTVALMLNGNRDFTISGTGSWANGLSTRNVYVNDPNTTLATSMVIAGGGSPTNVVGPGFLQLNGTASQNASTADQINLLGGTLRANNTQLGLTNTGGGVLVFSGGVLEIQNGTASVAGDFTRTLSASGGQGTVRWQGGGGGFSAFGSDAWVNIGGAGATLTWANPAGGFVGDGYALKFGSTQSNATLFWRNPIALDNGTPGNYRLREINVTQGTGTVADRTVMAGVISGTTSTDLIKTGTGVLELTAQNTYQGNTLIQGGTLVLARGASIGVPGSSAGNVVVGKGATLAGAGTVNADAGFGKSVIVNPGGAIRGGNPTADEYRLDTLTVNADVTINSTAADNGVLRVESSRTAANAAAASKIAVTGNQVFDLNPGAGNKFTIDLVAGANALQAGETYSITLATTEVAGNIFLNGASVPANTTLPTSVYTLQSSAYSFTGVSLAVDGTGQNLDLTFTVAPVPEPAVAFGVAAAGLGLGAFVRRRRAARPSE